MFDAARFSGLVVSLASWFLLGTACKSAPSESAPTHLLQQDRSAFYSYLRDLGMDNDPDKVFTLTNGVLHITGQHYGYLATKQSYENSTAIKRSKARTRFRTPGRLFCNPKARRFFSGDWICIG